MSGEILLYVGSAVITLWGIAHIIPTASVVRGFGPISRDNEMIITMEWIDEGLTLCFIGALVLVITIWGDVQNPVATLVYWASAAMLVALAIVSLFTGAKTSIVPIKICPVVKLTVAALLIAGTLIA